MIELIDSDLGKVKAEMKLIKQDKSKEASFLKKEYKKVDVVPDYVQKKLHDLEFLQKLYSPAKVMPVKVGELTINYKLYTAFMKKLKGFTTEIAVQKSSLLISYRKLGSTSRGTLELEDLSSYFENFKHIPLAIISDGSET
jgi:hypothetical protein